MQLIEHTCQSPGRLPSKLSALGAIDAAEEYAKRQYKIEPFNRLAVKVYNEYGAKMLLTMCPELLTRFSAKIEKGETKWEK